MKIGNGIEFLRTTNGIPRVTILIPNNHYSIGEKQQMELQTTTNEILIQLHK